MQRTEEDEEGVTDDEDPNIGNDWDDIKLLFVG